VSTDGGATDIRGLSEKEAAARLKAEGPNTLPQADRRTFIRIVLEILREPMFALLLGAAVIYLVLGDLKEAVVLGVFACTSVLIAVVQETRTERVLESRLLAVRGQNRARHGLSAGGSRIRTIGPSRSTNTRELCAHGQRAHP
jgi:Ca2+-transporting ATPase